MISSIQLPKSWQAMLGFGDDPQKREVGTVDLLILEPMGSELAFNMKYNDLK